MWKNIEIIAEVKTLSPFGFRSEKSWEELFLIAESMGDIISIHTDLRWDGSFELLSKARKMTKKPILAKGIHETDDEIKRCLEAGADFVLVVGRIPNIYQEKLMIEPNSLAELGQIPNNLRVVWNSRDLATGGLKGEKFAEARGIFPSWLCQASNITKVEDINPGANAILVGSQLEGFTKSLMLHVEHIIT